MRIRAILTTLLIACCLIKAQAQQAIYPAPGTLYDAQLHTIHITMPTDSLTALFAEENRWTNHRYPATFVYDGTDTLFDVGVRMKGNTSRNSKKLAFRIDFDEFKNQTYQGLKTINLNSNHNDPSLTRELLCAYVMQESNIISSRVNHVKVYFNGIYRGVYAQAEFINKGFLSSRFGENKGNLYKCSWPADLTWQGANQQTYKDIINPSPLNERAYELKTNETADDYSGFVALVNTINNASNFKQSIDTIFDVDAYLKVLAAEVLLGHWDNYAYNKNNYYLYQRTTDKKFYYIPYDMDNTLGVQWGVANINNRDVNAWGNNNNPLTTKLLAVPEFKQLYHQHIYSLCTTSFNSAKLSPKLDSVKTYLTPAVAVDSFYTQKWESDYGFTYTDWQQSYTQAWGNHVSFGIKPFIESRRSSALNQIPATGLNEIKQPMSVVFPVPASNQLLVSGNEAFNITLFDINGKLALKTFGNEVNTSELTNGMYILKVEGKLGTETHRITVWHE